MNRRPLVVGNWKMNGTLSESVILTRSIQSNLVSSATGPNYASIDVVIAPPFTAIASVSEALNLIRVSDVHLPPRNNARKSSTQYDMSLRVELGAQTMNEHPNGAYTGEISAGMLHELGVRWVILGHSERRMNCGETNDAIARKVKTALAFGLTPIIAVGETHEEHLAGDARNVVTLQTRAALSLVDEQETSRCVVAYEPIWAIGSGTGDDPVRAGGILAAVRACVPGLQNSRLLYGGSVRPENAEAFFAQPDIDGGLIGTASLHAQDFVAIIHAADQAGKVFQR